MDVLSPDSGLRSVEISVRFPGEAAGVRTLNKQSDSQLIREVWRVSAAISLSVNYDSHSAFRQETSDPQAVSCTSGSLR